MAGWRRSEATGPFTLSGVGGSMGTGLRAWPTPSEMTDRHDTVLSGGHLGQTRPLGGRGPAFTAVRPGWDRPSAKPERAVPEDSGP